MKLVIVESPAKAKTINKYLGSDYKVIASFGHIRDLPSKNGSVIPEDDFAIKYEISDKSTKYVSEISKYAKSASDIFLATDPDREGESISWHIIQVLIDEGIIKDKDRQKFKRISFNEITKKAIIDAVSKPRDVDEHLVNAQQARRALDYLVGFNLSPVLWRKMPGCKSAGRVQSVALRLLCSREDEIEKFINQEYWDINLDLLSSKKEKFLAKLTHLNNERLEKFSIVNAQQAEALRKDIDAEKFVIDKIEKKQQKRNPPPPFITSSLQQEAARKLNFSAKKTMQVAQKLYEGVDIEGETIGLITYMRTDGTSIASDAVDDIRALIMNKYGKEYLPSNIRIFASKVKNAQEAHEAIRPTNIKFIPNEMEKYLDKDHLRLYDLIWKRTVACQMENVIVNMVGVTIISNDKKFTLRANGSNIFFDGFYKIYREGKDDEEDEKNNMLPILEEGEKVDILNIMPQQHFTEPPPRYTEASLVKRLEELGIGRPSTYASIISVLQERKYAIVEKKRFTPTELGRLLVAFLEGYFAKYVEYDFTAQLEDDLDKVATGSMGWKDLLKIFWDGFIRNINEMKDHQIADVISYVGKALDFHLFGSNESEAYSKNKTCPECKNGQLSLKLGKYGAFLGCDHYPECNFKKKISNGSENAIDEGGEIIVYPDSRVIGQGDNGLDIVLKKGPYGWYIEQDIKIEEADKKSKNNKPKRCSIPANIDPNSLDINVAKKLLALPLSIGFHKDSGEEITMSIGRFGPYVKHQSIFASIPKSMDPFSISVDIAMDLIRKKIDKDQEKINTGKDSIKKTTKSPRNSKK